MEVKNIILGLGIVVVFGLVLWQGIQTFYPSPEYNDFCDANKGYESIYNATSCEANGGKWTQDAYPRPEVDNVKVTGYCDNYYQCNLDYQEANDSWSWKVFIICFVVGLILLLVGLFVSIPEPIGSSLIGSAVLSIFSGSMVNWRNFESAWRFVLLLVVLGLLIGLAIKFNKKDN